MTSSAATKNFTKSLFLFLLLFCTYSRADYGWIPRYKSLWAKLGVDYLSSKENFGSDGQRGDAAYQARLIEFTEFKFWAEAEYGLAQNWSAYLKMSANRGAIDPQTGAATAFPQSSGLGDIHVGSKWNLVRKPILFTVEIMAKIPTYSTSGLAADELAKGDGDFAAGLLTHGGFWAGKYLIFDLSPGFLFRSGGYNAQLLVNGMAEVIAHPVFFRLFFEYRYGLSKTNPATVIANNPEIGSGGTFGRLSKDSDLFSGGAKLGFNMFRQYRMEVNFQQAIAGNRAPNFWQVGLNFFASWDFFKEEKKIRIMEVPFETEQTNTPEKEN